MSRRIFTATCLVAAGLITTIADADVTVYTDRVAWEAAAESVATIGFTGFPQDTIIHDQYHASHGVLFSGGDERVQTGGEWSDFAGVRSSYRGVRVVGDEPRHAVAVEFVDETMQIVLFCQGFHPFYFSGFNSSGFSTRSLHQSLSCWSRCSAGSDPSCTRRRRCSSL